MDDAIELGNYLPLSFKSPMEQKYIEFLWVAFETNYTHEKYQSAFLACHMLTMSFGYFNIWQIRQTRPADFSMATVTSFCRTMTRTSVSTLTLPTRSARC